MRASTNEGTLARFTTSDQKRFSTSIRGSEGTRWGAHALVREDSILCPETQSPVIQNTQSSASPNASGGMESPWLVTALGALLRLHFVSLGVQYSTGWQLSNHVIFLPYFSYIPLAPTVSRLHKNVVTIQKMKGYNLEM